MELGWSVGEERVKERFPTEDFHGSAVGLGGFCLRHCAISSQWLNCFSLPLLLVRCLLLFLLLLLLAFLARFLHPLVLV